MISEKRDKSFTDDSGCFCSTDTSTLIWLTKFYELFLNNIISSNKQRILEKSIIPLSFKLILSNLSEYK
jgi:hypothetical protein